MAGVANAQVSTAVIVRNAARTSFHHPDPVLYWYFTKLPLDPVLEPRCNGRKQL
jgi:hypothetical protein